MSRGGNRDFSNDSGFNRMQTVNPIDRKQFKADVVEGDD